MYYRQTKSRVKDASNDIFNPDELSSEYKLKDDYSNKAVDSNRESEGKSKKVKGTKKYLFYFKKKMIKIKSVFDLDDHSKKNYI